MPARQPPGGSYPLVSPHPSSASLERRSAAPARAHPQLRPRARPGPSALLAPNWGPSFVGSGMGRPLVSNAKPGPAEAGLAGSDLIIH